MSNVAFTPSPKRFVSKVVVVVFLLMIVAICFCSVRINAQTLRPSMSHASNLPQAVEDTPVLLTDDLGRAIALDSVTMLRDPLPVGTSLNFSSDQRTRVMLFALNLDLLPGEPMSVVTAQAEDSQHTIYELPVEFVGKVAGFDWITQVDVKLTDELAVSEDVQLSVSLRGVVSNKALFKINPLSPVTSDSAFDPQVFNGSNSGQIFSMAVQQDGKIVIGGRFTTISGASRNSIARLNRDGSLDNTFNVVLGLSDSFSAIVNGIVVQSDGKILIVGDFDSYDGVPRKNIARLNSNGSLDTSFIPDPIYANSSLAGSINAVKLQSDGKILIGGPFTITIDSGRSNRFVARLNGDGSWDNSFITTTTAPNDCPCGATVNSIAIQSNGRILIGGDFFYRTSGLGTQVQFDRIARLNTDGSRDASFTPTTGTPGAGVTGSNIYAIAVQPSGRIIIGGDFIRYNNVARLNLAGLNADGSLDDSFATTTNGSVRQILTQPDGKLLIAGNFTTVNSFARVRTARLQTSGVVDITFNTLFVGPNNFVVAVATESDGRVLIGGTFTSVNSFTRRGIARLVNGNF
ncbi:MAG TPA: delta-60 repeat domain-containing protein [Pyrinomonadaceae bacterium]|nr:delta-60 repeat domain-containing protein [Pyrinomonadaceae bacterium]